MLLDSVLFLAAHALGAMTRSPSPADAFAIQKTLALFPIAVDNKRYEILSEVFTPDARFQFSPTTTFFGLPAIKGNVSAVLEKLNTQHALSTLFINMTDDKAATATNYFQGTFFAKANTTGEMLQIFDYYVDDLVKFKGQWLIKHRVLNSFVSPSRRKRVFRRPAMIQIFWLEETLTLIRA